MRKIIFLFLFVSVYLHAETYIYKIPVSILIPLIYTESNFNPSAIGRNKDSIDYGLLQLNSKCLPYFAWKYNKGRPFDPMNASDNLRIGCAYLNDLFIYTGSWYDAIWAYNAGPGNWEKGRMFLTTKLKLNKIYTALLRRDFVSTADITRTTEVVYRNRGSLYGWEEFEYGEVITKDISWIPQIMKQPWGFNQGLRTMDAKPTKKKVRTPEQAEAHRAYKRKYNKANYHKKVSRL